MRISNRFSRLAAATLAAAALFLLSPSAVNAADTQTLTGTFVVWAELGPGVQVPALHTYHSDGTITSSDVLMFGGLGIPIRITPMHGVWERTGPSAFATTNLFLVYDASSSLLIGFGRARAAVFTGKDADQISGTAYAEFLPCPSPFACPDPQAAGAAWAPFPGVPPSLTLTGTRLRLVPPPLLP
jgi:hypothetical protein